MALSLQDPVLAKHRLFHAVSFDTSTRLQMTAFFSWLMQQGGRPNLQVVEFTALSNTDQVLADVACRLYALILAKATATASWSKFTDNATTGSTDGTQNLSLWMAQIGRSFLCYPNGLALANGLTARGNTTGTGNTTAGAAGATGVVLLGAAS